MNEWIDYTLRTNDRPNQYYCGTGLYLSIYLSIYAQNKRAFSRTALRAARPPAESAPATAAPPPPPPLLLLPGATPEAAGSSAAPAAIAIDAFRKMVLLRSVSLF